MFPLIAIGAALFGGLAIADAAAPEKKAPRKVDPQVVENPQSYIVTPVNSSQVRQITPLEGVRNMIF